MTSQNALLDKSVAVTSKIGTEIYALAGKVTVEDMGEYTCINTLGDDVVEGKMTLYVRGRTL